MSIILCFPDTYGSKDKCSNGVTGRIETSNPKGNNALNNTWGLFDSFCVYQVVY